MSSELLRHYPGLYHHASSLKKFWLGSYIDRIRLIQEISMLTINFRFSSTLHGLQLRYVHVVKPR